MPSVRPATLIGNNIAIRPAKPFRCRCATVRPPGTPSPYTICTAPFTKKLCAPILPTSLTLVTDMHAHINAFEIKLRLWEAQLANGQLEQFLRLAACVPDDGEPGTCVSVVASLRAEFASVSQESGCWLRTSSCLPPSLTFPWTTPRPLKMEFVELQCNDELKTKFYNSSPLSFFRDIALPCRNFPKYIAHVQRIVAMFGGTYCCEQLFSKMKYTKSRLRSLLSDSHLNGILLLLRSSIEPDIDILLHGKQHQPSH